jgi:hypothetical protein
MKSLAEKLDWNRMMGFEQIAADRALLRAPDNLGAKVGVKIGNKVGGKIGVKTGLKIGAKGVAAA